MLKHRDYSVFDNSISPRRMCFLMLFCYFVICFGFLYKQCYTEASKMQAEPDLDWYTKQGWNLWGSSALSSSLPAFLPQSFSRSVLPLHQNTTRLEINSPQKMYSPQKTSTALKLGQTVVPILSRWPPIDCAYI